MNTAASPSSGSNSPSIDPHRRLRWGVLVLSLVPLSGCFSRSGPVAVAPDTSSATPEERKDKEKNPLILRD
jgi:hypothetical protein